MAIISQELINEIKAKNDIVDVIGSYIDVNEKNKALCPFHDDHNASLSIHPEKQIFKCFSCGESGNVVSFVQKYNGVSFVDALKILVNLFEVAIPILNSLIMSLLILLSDKYFKASFPSLDIKLFLKYFRTVSVVVHVPCPLHWAEVS